MTWETGMMARSQGDVKVEVGDDKMHSASLNHCNSRAFLLKFTRIAFFAFKVCPRIEVKIVLLKNCNTLHLLKREEFKSSKILVANNKKKKYRRRFEDLSIKIFIINKIFKKFKDYKPVRFIYFKFYFITFFYILFSEPIFL